MLNSNGFDVWANGYDENVQQSDAGGVYPFAGYATMLQEIYGRICACAAKNVLDIGFGTGTLAAKLYERGCNLFGQDFSSRMIELAQQKMPRAKLYQGDFSLGLVQELKQQRYDAIVATYALHHLTGEQKVALIRQLLPLLNEKGCIYMGDVAFATRAELEQCQAQAGDEWDRSEIYFVFDELKQAFPQLEFERVSYCAGLLTLKKSV